MSDIPLRSSATIKRRLTSTPRIMDMISDSSHTVGRLASSGGSFDCIPDEVIGIILSHLPSVRDVVRASVTSRKWHKAAWNDIYRLNFIESDFVSCNTVMKRINREAIISQVVMKTKSLRMLSICMDRAVSIPAAPLVTWLDFAKKSLTSFTLENGILPNLNILDILGGGHSKLKHLKWEAVYIPTIDTSMHSFQSLVSLSLARTKCALSSQSLEELLGICPSLESLWLEGMHVSSEADALCQIKSSSLKALTLYGGFQGIDYVVLNMESLDFLTVVGVTLQSIILVQGRQCGLRSLTVEYSVVTSWDLGDSLNSLRAFSLNQEDDRAEEWPKFYQLISTASTLQKLQLSGCMCRREDINLDEIAASFPTLTHLAVSYEHASRAFTAGESSTCFQNLIILELSAKSINEGFASWIALFLKRCPSLQRLTIAGEVCLPKTRCTKSFCKFNAAIIDIIRLYPQVKVSFDLY